MSELRTVDSDPGATDDIERRQTDRAVFGFWVFLMSDAVIFALLFATYGAMLGATAGGPTAAGEFKIGSALIETVILLSSSFTFGMASLSMKYRKADDDGAYPSRSGFLSAFLRWSRCTASTCWAAPSGCSSWSRNS